jgi:membrane protease YdiL (CAAX protease family)
MSPTREPFPGRYAVITIALPSVLLYFLTLVLGIVLLFFSPLGGEMMNAYSVQHLEFFFMFFRIPLTLNLFTPTVLALSVYVACFVVAWFGHGSYLSSLTNLRIRTARIPNWLLVMPLITSALLLVVVLITWLQDINGIPTGNLILPPASLFSSLSTSPISEELNFRITTLGLIVAIRSILFWRVQGSIPKRLVYSFLSPDLAKTNAGLDSVASTGLRNGIHWSEWIMLLLSSAVFGYAHIATGSSWEIGKVTTAAVAGFVMGLAFLVYGAYASILVHWFFNYYTQVSWIGTLAFDPSSQAYELFAGLNNLISGWTYLVGIMGLIIVAWFLLWSRQQSSVPDASGDLSL